jgi:hypothetical protein
MIFKRYLLTYRINLIFNIIIVDVDNSLVDPAERPEIPKIELHSVMEVKLGIM